MNEQDYEQLTLFQGDSPASRLVLPGSEEAQRMTVISGQRCCALLKRSDPLGLLARMLLESSVWRSTRCYLTWKPSATPARRLLFRLVPSTPRTDEIDARLWATPNTMDYLPQRSPEALQRQAETSRKGRTRPANLREQVCEDTVRMWPTPRANDAEKRGAVSPEPRNGLPGAVRLWPTPKARDAKDTTNLPPSRISDPGKDSLVQRVGRLWPTPTAGQCGMTSTTGGRPIEKSTHLETQVYLAEKSRMYATPQAGDYRSPNKNPGGKSESANLPQSSHSLPTQCGGQLNPTWVEWLMGFPTGWTDLDASEMP